MIRRAIYPGSFDPVTNGHLDVIERARKLFDEVIVAVAHNDQKHPLFSLEERLDLLRATIGKTKNVEIAPLDGLLVDFAVARKATAVIRGLRAISDFEFEFQMALMNRKLEANVETIFLMPKEEYTYLSSRIVKEIARLGGDVSDFVPGRVAKLLRKKLERGRFISAKSRPKGCISTAKRNAPFRISRRKRSFAQARCATRSISGFLKAPCGRRAPLPSRWS
jgi:pantetheine-phosphate adenylyltransferase